MPPPPSPPPSPIVPGGSYDSAIGWQVVYDQDCPATESARRQICTDIMIPGMYEVVKNVTGSISQVYCNAECGSLVITMYIQLVQGTEARNVSLTVDRYLSTPAQIYAAFPSLTGTVVRIEQAYSTQVAIGAPPAAPPPPPSPPPACSSHCTILLDGASLSSRAYNYMCLKYVWGRGTQCRPMYSQQCPSDMTPCLQPHAYSAAHHPSLTPLCQDQVGRWAYRKCARKARRDKCHKRKMRERCPASCNLCGHISPG